MALTNENFGGWLTSKQKSKRSLEILEKYKNCYTNMDSVLRQKVVQQVKNNRTSIGRVLYKTRNCYSSNMDFVEFARSVADVGGMENLKILIAKSVDIIIKKDGSLKKFPREEIAKAIKVYIWYQPYVGFAFEQRIRDLLESNGYSCYASNRLDKDYAIDLQVSKGNRTIGLQFKSASFLSLSRDKRKQYYYKNSDAIQYKWVEGVYYIFHDLDCEIMANEWDSLTNYTKACLQEKFDRKIVYAEQEINFLKDVEEVFLQMG